MVAWRVKFERVEPHGNGDDLKTVDVPYELAVDEPGAVSAARGISFGLVVPDTEWAAAGSTTVAVALGTYLDIAEWMPVDCSLVRRDLLRFQ